MSLDGEELMTFRLSRSLIDAAEAALLDLYPNIPNDPQALIPIAGTPFFLGRVAPSSVREDFLVHGFIQHTLTQETFYIGLQVERKTAK